MRVTIPHNRKLEADIARKERWGVLIEDVLGMVGLAVLFVIVIFTLALLQ